MDHLVDEMCALASAGPQLAQWMSSVGPEIAAGFTAAGPQVQQRLAALGPEIAGEFATAGPHLKEMASAGPQLAAAIATQVATTASQVQCMVWGVGLVRGFRV